MGWITDKTTELGATGGSFRTGLAVGQLARSTPINATELVANLPLTAVSIHFTLLAAIGDTDRAGRRALDATTLTRRRLTKIVTAGLASLTIPIQKALVTLTALPIAAGARLGTVPIGLATAFLIPANTVLAILTP